MPTVLISSGRIVAASGVPNRAEKEADMPTIIERRLALSADVIFSFSARKFPRLPPICKAAPSRPEEPPNRCVMTVDTKISGAIRNGIGSSWRIE